MTVVQHTPVGLYVLPYLSTNLSNLFANTMLGIVIK